MEVAIVFCSLLWRGWFIGLFWCCAVGDVVCNSVLLLLIVLGLKD